MRKEERERGREKEIDEDRERERRSEIVSGGEGEDSVCVGARRPI